MSIEALVGTILSVLTPYVAVGGKEFAKAAGKEAFEKAKTLFHLIEGRVAGDREASDALTHFQQKPDLYRPIVKAVLENVLNNDESLTSEVSRLVHGLRPQLEVIQKIKEAKNVIGVITPVIPSSAKIDQDVTKAGDVTGIVIGTPIPPTDK